jgi:hypothetical protein
MAATEKHTERRGASEELRPDGRVVWRASQTWQVTEAETEADAKAQIPYTLGSDHPVYGGALKVNLIDPQRRGYNYWELRVDWSSDTPEGGNLNTRPRYRWGSLTVTEEVDRDYDGNPITNSVGDPPINHPTRDFNDLTLTYLRWEPFFNLRRSLLYRNAINLDNFQLTTREINATVYGGECKCADIAPVGEIEQGQSLVQVAYEFVLRARILILGQDTSNQDDDAWASGFDWRFLDAGYRGWYALTTGSGDDATSEQKRAQFWEAGEVTTEPTRLNGKGKPINDTVTVRGAEPIEFPGPPTGASLDERFVDADPGAVFLIYKRHARLAFRGLIPFFQ